MSPRIIRQPGKRAVAAPIAAKVCQGKEHLPRISDDAPRTLGANPRGLLEKRPRIRGAIPQQAISFPRRDLLRNCRRSQDFQHVTNSGFDEDALWHTLVIGNVRETIAIVGGTGAEGMALALRFARAGARVRVGSRTVERARAAATLIAGKAGSGAVEGFENAVAVREADVIVLTVPPDAQISTLQALASSFRPGAVLVDATVRLKSEQNSALLAAEHVPEGVRVASAFHTLSAGLAGNLEESIDSDVLICADDPEAKSAVSALVQMLPGARPVDLGGLKKSRLIENTVQLLIALNRAHKVKHSGIRITGL